MNQLALARRELWEHRSLYVTPAIIAMLAALATITGQVSISGFSDGVNLAILGGTNLGENERAMALSVLMSSLSVLLFIGMWILSIFYPLDALYAERKDRSILFWRSTPCTDFETVLSKLLTAILVIPLLTFVAIVVTHVVVLIIWSIWLSVQGGNAGHLIWSAVPFLDNWSATVVFLLAATLWAAPMIGWFLFVSAFAKRSPFLMAFLPLIILPMFEQVLNRSSVFAEAVITRALPFPLLKNINPRDWFDGDETSLVESDSLFDLFNLSGFLSSPGLWAGIVVCGLFATAAIYVRRYRDDS